MLDLSDVEDRLIALKDVVQTQTEGLMKLLGIMATMEATQRKHTGQLIQIHELLIAPEPAEESPLSKALGALADGIKEQAVVLARIESAVTAKAR